MSIEIEHIIDLFKNSSTCEKHRKLLDDYYLARNYRESGMVKVIIKECVDPDGKLQSRGDIKESHFDASVTQIQELWEKRIPQVTEKDLENLSKINRIIERQDSYGMQNWDIKKGVVASWSNGSELWYLDRIYTEHLKGKKPDEKVVLDANQIVAPVTEKEFLRIHRRLAPLPLYYGSYEAKKRKIVDWTTADNIWLHGQIKRLLREKE